MTVLGQIPVEELGITQMHEHLLIQADSIWHKPSEGFLQKLVRERVKQSNLWLLWRNDAASKDNLRLDDVDLAAEEVSKYERLGGRTLVEVTPTNLHRDPKGMQTISKKSNVHVICGCAYYLEHTLSDRVRQRSTKSITSEFVHEITQGISNTGVKPGIIGEIGTSSPITKTEKKMLRAAAQAHVQTGVPIDVHLSHPRREGNRVLDILEAEGVDARRVALSHLDQVLTPEALDDHESLVERGAYVMYDDFGEEYYLQQWSQPGRLSTVLLPRDIERADAISRLIDRDCLEKIMLSSDISQKIQLEHYGGFGYHHILRDTVPMLRAKGITEKEIHTMLVENPRRFFSS